MDIKMAETITWSEIKNTRNITTSLQDDIRRDCGSWLTGLQTGQPPS
jgi:hypothetical protein